MITILPKALAVLFLLLSIPALADYPDPVRKQSEVDAFTRKKLHAPGSVVVTGSSSIRAWQSIHEDLEPTKVIASGISGTNMNDLGHYLDELVLRHRPEAVVIYQGDNDVVIGGVSVDEIMEKFEEVVSRTRAALPNVDIFIMSVKPSLARWSIWSKSIEINQRFAALADQLDELSYVDVATPMLGPDGQPRSDIFVEDGLHMNAKGYRIWASVLQPILAKRRLEL